MSFRNSDNEQRYRRDRGKPAGKPIHAIGKVNNRRYAENPQNRQGKLQDDRKQDIFTRKRIIKSGKCYAGGIDEYGRRDLHNKLWKRRKVLALRLIPIIDSTDDEQKRTACEYSAGLQGKVSCDKQIGKEEAYEDDIACRKRDWLPMELALDILAGLVHKIQAEGQPAKRRN